MKMMVEKYLSRRKRDVCVGKKMHENASTKILRKNSKSLVQNPTGFYVSVENVHTYFDHVYQIVHIRYFVNQNINQQKNNIITKNIIITL